ncbi:hypothetical protein Tco_0193949 [Tanacetum coccineum]
MFRRRSILGKDIDIVKKGERRGWEDRTRSAEEHGNAMREASYGCGVMLSNGLQHVAALEKCSHQDQEGCGRQHMNLARFSDRSMPTPNHYQVKALSPKRMLNLSHCKVLKYGKNNVIKK